jgi:autotransporter-associated beta strand protein
LVGNTGSLKGDIENNAFVVYDQAGDGIYSGELTGTGGLTKVGDGSLTLSGENAFSGDSAVAGGTLIAGRNGAFGTGSYELSSTGKLDLNDHDQSIGALSGSGDIELGTGSLTLNQTINGLFEGNITGDGGLVKNGDGLLYLLGQNSYSGGTTINAGEVIGHSDSLSGDISVATAAALTFSQEDDGVFDGTLSGQGDLVKLGAGKLVFNNASDAIGSVTVEAGSFIVGESSLNSTATLTTDSIYVQSGALVGGHGTVEADVFILSGGSLSPGNSYGVNTIRGDLTLNPGAFFDVEVDPADENRGDKTIVQGTAYLTGAIVRHFGTGGVLEDYLNKQWTILTADSLDGTFYTAVSNLAFLAPSLNYTNTDVLLAFNAISGFSDSVVTNNQKAVAASLETLPPSSQLYQSVVSFATVQNVGAVMDQLSGEVFSSLTPGVRHVAALSNRVVVRHAFDLSNLAAARADAAPAAGLGDFANHRLWVSLGGSYGILNGSTDSAKMTISGAELSGGYDFNLANGWLGGLVLHFNDKKFNVVDRASDIDADTYGVSVYLGRNIDLSHGRLRLLLGGNWTRYNFKSERHVYLPAHQTLTANFNGDSYQVFFEAAYAKTLSWGGIIEPYASFGWTSFRIGGFREKGGSAAMISPSERQDNAFSIIGLRATAPLGQRFSIDVDLGWRHEFGSVSNKKYLAFAEGGNRFGVTGVSPNRDELLVGLRGNVSLNDNWKLGLQYNGNFGNNGQNHAGSLIISASW